MKSQLLLLQLLLSELGSRCCTSTTRDIENITRRVEKEGISFLTITLPAFGKDLLEALDLEQVSSTHFLGYRKRGCLPRLFSGFTEQIFDMKSGRLLDDPSIVAIHSVLQATQLMSKVNIPCSDARVSAAIDKYIQCEQEVVVSDAKVTHQELREFNRMGNFLFGSVFAKMANAVYDGDILPKHGPGTTAEKLIGNEKYFQTEWPDRLENLFPAGEYIFSSWSHQLGGTREVNYLDPGAERPVRVITVPKTLKTPRIIAIEPVAQQYMQQGLLEKLVKWLETDDFVSPFIGFTDQVPNQDLARVGSLSGNLATLDLSEASDRVSNQHVLFLLADYPYFSAAVQATRSTTADVPGYGVIPLSKFASMGSALCFPMEAMVFLTLIFLGIEKELKRPLSRKDLKDLRGKVRVYGDDIIVPVEYVLSVVSFLEAFGLKVNGNKSFWTGKFRESCGKEYYAGHDVSIVKVRQLLPSSRRDVLQIVSTVSLRNQLFHAGYSETVDWLDAQLVRILRYFPEVLPTSAVLGRHSYGFKPEKMCPRLHVPLVKGYTIRDIIPINSIDDDAALLKYFLKRGDKPMPKGHMERSGRPKSFDIKLGWSPPY